MPRHAKRLSFSDARPSRLIMGIGLLVLIVSVLGSSKAWATHTPVGTTQIDQSFTSPSNLGVAINDCCRFVAQTFTAGLTGTLAEVHIDVGSSSVFPLHVAIRTVSGGVPTPTVLGETTLSSSSAPLSRLIKFPQAIDVVAGRQYAISVKYEGAPPPGPGQTQGGWAGATGNVYPGGELYFSFVDGIAWFAAGPGFDVHFQTYVTTDLQVDTDIKPGSDPNSINCINDEQSIPVAILTTDEFDATAVDHTTVAFEGASETHVNRKSGEPGRHQEDVDGDGDTDLVLHFRLGDTGLTCDSTEATLTGETFDGQVIESTDAVRMIDQGGGKP